MIKFIQEIRSKNPKEKRNLNLKTIYILLFCLVFGIGGVNGQTTLAQSGFTGVIVPQYMGSGTNNRLPVMFRATVTGLTASTSYRYYVQATLSSDLGGANSGAGNPVLLNSAGTTYSTPSAPNLTANFETFTTDASGNYTGWFGFVNTANSRFTAGNTIYPAITINAGGSSNSVGSRRALDLGITVFAYSASAGATKGSFLNSASSGTAKNLVALYDNVAGTGRPIYVTYIESAGITNTTSGFTTYSTSAGNWGALIPNALTNGVRRIEQFSSSTGNAVNDNQDADGTWPTGSINTTTSTNNLTAKTISGTDAPLNVATTVVLSSPNPSVSAANLNVSSTNNPIYRFDIAVTNANATLTGATITTTGTYSVTDVSNLKCWYQSSSTFNSGTATLLATKASLTTAGSQSFTSFTRNVIASGTTGYIFFTIDIVASPTNLRTIGVSSITTTDITFTSRTSFTGTTNAGGTQTIVTSTAPTISSSAASSIATTGAQLNGNVTSDGNSTVTDRGFVYNTSSGVTINDNKTTVSGTTGAYTLTPSFSVNTQYYFRAYAINGIGTTLSTPELSFYTLANTPGTPTVNNPTSSTLDVAINVNSNPSATEFAIQETGGNYVQANGALDVSAVWQNAATWGTKTVIGLSPSTTYTFQVKARNGANTETGFGSTASNTTIAVSSPTITPSGTLIAVNTTYGTASASPSSFSVSGAAMTAGITVTPPVGFEVCLISDFSTTIGTNSSALTFGAAGTIASTTVFVRLAATASVSGSPFSGNIVLSSSDATPQNVATASSTVTAKGLTITGLTGSDKTYDGSTSASFTGTPAYSGLVNGETFSVTGTPTSSFATKTVGSAKAITISGYTAPSINYTVAQPTGLTGKITALALTVSTPAVTTKSYDATNSAIITGSLSGIIAPDEVTLSGTGTFASVNVGTAIDVTSTSTLGGADAGNYTLTQPIGLTGNITIANQTITFGALAAKTTSDADFSPGATASSGLTVSYSSSNTSVATIVSGQINILSAGTSIITASQAGNGNFNAAASVDQTLVVTEPLAAGDIAIIGYNSSGSPDNFAILVLKDLPAGTVFYANDNEVTSAGGTSFADLSEGEASFTVKSGQTVSKGTVIILPWGGAAVSTSTYDWSTTTGAGLNNGPVDDIYIYQASSISETTPSLFIYHVNLGGTGQRPNGLTSGVTSLTSTATATRYKISGVPYNCYKSSILNSIGNTSSNWQSTAPSSAGDWTFTIQSGVNNPWIGASSTWNTAANWGCGAVPTTSEDIIISSGNPILDIDFTLNSDRSLTLSGSGSLTVNPSRTLTIAGSADFGGKSVTIKSDATGTASLGQVSGTLANASNVTIERHIPRRRAFRFLASPVTTSNFISGSWQQATHITGSLTGQNGFDQSNSGTASLFTYNTSSEAWTAIANTNSTNLNIGTGYRMLIRGDRNINLNTTTPQDSAALVLSATGSIITGNVVFGAGSVSSSPEGIPSLNSTVSTGINGWALIGNPYASAVNWANVTKSNVSTSFATWNVNNAGRGSYVYHDGSAGTGTGASNIINSGQSIFVQTTASNPSITFTEASKVSSTPPSHFKKSISDLLNIDIFIGDRAYDGLSVMFDANNSNDYDVQDFIKLVNPEINFYSYLADGTKLAMNNMKEIGTETIVPLGLNGVFNGGSYELKFSNQNSFSNSEVYLKDKFLKQTHDLKSINNLTFTVTADSNSFGENRFELIFSKSATGLNNELSSNNNNFIVFPNPANNVLNLSLTTTKEDNYSFTIFNQLGEMVNNGNLDFNAKRTHALNIENLSSGVYFIQVKNGKTAQTIKFIK